MFDVYIDIPTSAKLSIRLPSGKQLKRRFAPTDTVRSVYALIASLEPESRDRAFEVMQSMPLKSLDDALDLTIAEAGLSGMQVVMRWKA